MQSLPNTSNCFACGLQNRAGLQLRMETDGRLVRSVFVPRPEHAGFTHAVHGGITTTALDELMAWAIIAAVRRPAYSVEFTVRFARPIGIGETVVVTGEMVSNRRNRLFETRGEVRNQENELCASATGKYLALGEADAEKALQDFPEELRSYFAG